MIADCVSPAVLPLRLALETQMYVVGGVRRVEGKFASIRIRLIALFRFAEVLDQIWIDRMWYHIRMQLRSLHDRAWRRLTHDRAPMTILEHSGKSGGD